MSARLHRLMLVVMLALGAALVGAASASAFTFTTIDDPNGTTAAMGINSRGDIVGQFLDNSACAHLHGFVKRGGTYRTLADPVAGTTLVVAGGINEEGVIVGYYSTTSPCVTGGGPVQCPPGCHGFLLRDGRYTTLDAQIPNVTVIATFALGINAQGEIVGRYDDSSQQQHGFILRHGVYTSLDFPGASLTNAYGINERGEIAGYYSRNGADASCTPCASFVRSSDGATYTPLTVSVADSSPRILARGINSRGDVVGNYTNSQGNQVAFLLMRGLSLALAAGGSDTIASGINSDGDIVGNYVDTRGTSHGFLLTDEHRGDDRH